MKENSAQRSIRQSKEAAADWLNEGKDIAKIECIKTMRIIMGEPDKDSEMFEFMEDQERKLMYSTTLIKNRDYIKILDDKTRNNQS